MKKEKFEDSRVERRPVHLSQGKPPDSWCKGALTSPFPETSDGKTEDEGKRNFSCRVHENSSWSPESRKPTKKTRTSFDSDKKLEEKGGEVAHQNPGRG